MKATLWLWSAVTAVVCVSLQVSARPYSDTRVIQDNSLLSLKRTKPSLSIVNPLDVLRQRIILEMARRQMRENTRQVELNKALLREIGKRSSNIYDGLENPPDYTYYDRKPYNQRTVPDEDDLDAMVESLLRSSHLAPRERKYASKLQRVRSVNDRQTLPSSHSSVGQDQEAQTQLQQQSQQPQMDALFNNEQETLQAKNPAVGRPLSGYQERDNSNDNGQHEDDDDDLTMSGGSSAQKVLQEGDSFLEPSQAGQPTMEARQTVTDRNTGSDLRPRYVYGMYKNRYAN